MTFPPSQKSSKPVDLLIEKDTEKIHIYSSA